MHSLSCNWSVTWIAGATFRIYWLLKFCSGVIVINSQQRKFIDSSVHITIVHFQLIYFRHGINQKLFRTYTFSFWCLTAHSSRNSFPSRKKKNFFIGYIDRVGRLVFCWFFCWAHAHIANGSSGAKIHICIEPARCHSLIIRRLRCIHMVGIRPDRI